MCIHVGECPTSWGFLVSYNSKMAIDSSLDWEANVGGCYINWFMFPSIPMDVD
jgi:hypothetical protein